MSIESCNAKLGRIVKSLKRNCVQQNSSLVIPEDFDKFNEMIGLPLHPVTLRQTQLMPYQLEFIKMILPGRSRLYQITKSRQMGATELVLRVLAHQCFFKYEGVKIIIIAGTREKTAEKIIRRFKKLFDNIQSTILKSTSHKLTMINETEIEILPSNSDAIRGDTKIKAIFVDEAAHFKLEDDSVVLDSIIPLVSTNNADLFLVSTPNGRRGFFYDISVQQNQYYKLQWDYTVAIGFIYDRDKIEQELLRNDIDVDQEYRCQFTSSRNSIFGDEFDAEDYEAEQY